LPAGVINVHLPNNQVMKKQSNTNEEGLSDKKEDQHIEWDNGEVTYGHSVIQSDFKRKNAPSESHEQTTGSDSSIIGSLKNKNLSQDEDIANRNGAEEKGIGGKDI